MNEIELENLPKDIQEAIVLPKDETVIDIINARLIDVKAIVRGISQYRSGILLASETTIIQRQLFYPVALLIFTERHLIIVNRKMRYQPPYKRYLEVHKLGYDEIIEPFGDGKPLNIVARIDGELELFQFFQFFEGNYGNPGITTKGKPISSDEFLEKLKASRRD